MSTTQKGLSQGPPPTGMELPPQLVLARMMSGYAVSQLIYVAAKLGIADRLKDGPLTIDALAGSARTDQSSLLRVMRGLAAAGLFKESSGKQFELTPLGQYLRTTSLSHWRQLRYSVRIHIGPGVIYYTPWRLASPRSTMSLAWIVINTSNNIRTLRCVSMRRWRCCHRS
jgi:hypothetical protein